MQDIDFLYGRRILADEVAARFGERYGLDEAFTVVEPVNAADVTTVTGLEFEVQTSLDWLPKPFDGIVLYGNYSLINSQAFYPFTFSKLDSMTFQTTFIDTVREGSLPGQSRQIANASLGYDRGGFSGRVSFNYQGASINFIGANPELDNYTDDYLRVDFSATYKVTPAWSVQANVNNILNRIDRNAVGVERRFGNSSIFGTMAWIGVRFTGLPSDRE